jgi:hypothetical protein
MESQRSKTRSEVRSSTKVPGVPLNKKVYKCKLLEMDPCIKYLEHLIFGLLLGLGPHLKSCYQRLYVIRIVMRSFWMLFCYGGTSYVGGYFWMLFYHGDIFSVWGTLRRLSRASCYFMNYGDLCYGDLYSVVGIFRGFTNAPFFHVTMLTDL